MTTCGISKVFDRYCDITYRSIWREGERSVKTDETIKMINLLSLSSHSDLFSGKSAKDEVGNSRFRDRERSRETGGGGEREYSILVLDKCIRKNVKRN